MNILFLTLLDFWSIKERGLYTDLMREFVKNNHKMYIVSPVEKRKGQPTQLLQSEEATILKLQIGNITKTNMIEKGISTLTLESKFVNGIKKYFSNIKFDLIIYSTPPITLLKAIKYVKNRDNAKTYLLLKDIFPQNAVDLGLLDERGIKGILYRFFREKEKELYKYSDIIGCMSQANVNYVLRNNPLIQPAKIEVCPNSIEPEKVHRSEEIRVKTRLQFNIPQSKTVFIYGGNLGKPQGIDFFLEVLKSNKDNSRVHFVIVGSGTEFLRISDFFNAEKLENVLLLNQLPTTDYDKLVAACDVGLIFLDKRFTIPNFPSRLLSYMQASMPVLAATDPNTDIGQIIESAGFGYWCESGDLLSFNLALDKLIDDELRKQMGNNAWNYLIRNYTSNHSYEVIMRHFE